MKTQRIKLSAPAIRSRAEMEATMSTMRDLTIQRNALQAQREAAVKAIDDQLAPRLDGLKQQLEMGTECLRAWAEANPAEFAGRRSLETSHGTLGWRTGMPALKTLAGWTWDRVLTGLLDLGKYIRTKPEVDKQAILADRDTLGDAGLRTLGVRAVQEEPFFVQPRVEEIEQRQTATPA